MSGVVGAVLAGGAGSRLGGEKPGVLLAGRPLLWYPLAALHGALEQVAVVAKEETELPAVGHDVLIWREPAEPRHPLAGVAEALRRADGRAVVVLACDLPLVTSDLVRMLATADAGGAPAVVASTPDRGLQPLCARYEPEALEAVGAGLASGARAVEVAAALEPVILDVPEDLLRNVNTPADLAAAEAAVIEWDSSR